MEQFVCLRMACLLTSETCFTRQEYARGDSNGSSTVSACRHCQQGEDNAKAAGRVIVPKPSRQGLVRLRARDASLKSCARRTTKHGESPWTSHWNGKSI